MKIFSFSLNLSRFIYELLITFSHKSIRWRNRRARQMNVTYTVFDVERNVSMDSFDPISIMRVMCQAIERPVIRDNTR